jgi:hypothetical protein
MACSHTILHGGNGRMPGDIRRGDKEGVGVGILELLVAKDVDFFLLHVLSSLRIALEIVFLGALGILGLGG